MFYQLSSAQSQHRSKLFFAIIFLEKQTQQQKEHRGKTLLKKINRDAALEKVAELRGSIENKYTIEEKVAELGWRSRNQQIPPTIAF